MRPESFVSRASPAASPQTAARANGRAGAAGAEVSSAARVMATDTSDAATTSSLNIALR